MSTTEESRSQESGASGRKPGSNQRGAVVWPFKIAQALLKLLLEPFKCIYLRTKIFIRDVEIEYLLIKVERLKLQQRNLLAERKVLGDQVSVRSAEADRLVAEIANHPVTIQKLRGQLGCPTDGATQIPPVAQGERDDHAGESSAHTTGGQAG